MIKPLAPFATIKIAGFNATKVVNNRAVKVALKMLQLKTFHDYGSQELLHTAHHAVADLIPLYDEFESYMYLQVFLFRSASCENYEVELEDLATQLGVSAEQMETFKTAAGNRASFLQQEYGDRYFEPATSRRLRVQAVAD